MTISTEVMWIIGVFTTIIGSLVTAIVLLYMNSQRSFNNELKEGLQESMKKHEHHYKKNQEQDIEIQRNRLEVLALQKREPFDPEKMADNIVMKLKVMYTDR